MAELQWPDADRRKLIGSRMTRLDGPVKATGAAKYAYDMNRPDMLYAKIFQAAPASARILNIDTSEAEKMPGVEAIVIDRSRRGEVAEVNYQGMVILALAARSEELALEALKKIKVSYEIAEPVMDDHDPSLASGREQLKEQGDAAAGFAEADTISEGYYGAAQITHCCLEAHGQVSEFRDGELYIWPSTQSVSGYAGTVSRGAEVPTENIHVDCQYMGGGFGSKFASDKWGVLAAKLSKMTGKPVKLMLERDQELKVAGHRPSAFAKVKVGVKKDGTITAWESDCWGSGGMQRWRMPPLPYVFKDIPNYKTRGRGIITNKGLTRAWRGPNHPQGALITMSALDDAAAAIGMDPMSFFKKNLHLTSLPEVYAEEFELAAEMI
ncbi:MAG: xanthine dehydrogenase family protein molybdopterin-binding subunit, partial [Candidatus Hydrogenedentes bacterium]|nr:xanthine dehydrogenase family protein molybdopterin-binding subunit [Candidatus Hydrogenedentota bacterium]